MKQKILSILFGVACITAIIGCTPTTNVTEVQQPVERVEIQQDVQSEVVENIEEPQVVEEEIAEEEIAEEEEVVEVDKSQNLSSFSFYGDYSNGNGDSINISYDDWTYTYETIYVSVNVRNINTACYAGFNGSDILTLDEGPYYIIINSDNEISFESDETGSVILSR